MSTNIQLDQMEPLVGEVPDGPQVGNQMACEILFKKLRASMQLLRDRLRNVATQPARRLKIDAENSLNTTQHVALSKKIKSCQERNIPVPWTEISKQKLFQMFSVTKLQEFGKQIRKRKAPESSLPSDTNMLQLQQQVVQLQNSCVTEFRNLRQLIDAQNEEISMRRMDSDRQRLLIREQNKEIGMLKEDCSGQWQRFVDLQSEKECLNRHDRCQERVKQLEAENESLRKKVCDVKVELNPYVAADSRSEYENWELNKLRDENQQLSGLIEEHEKEWSQRFAYVKQQSEHWERYARKNDESYSQWKREVESKLMRKNDEIDRLYHEIRKLNTEGDDSKLMKKNKEIDRLLFQIKELEDKCNDWSQLVEAVEMCTVVESRIVEYSNRLSGTKQL